MEESKVVDDSKDSKVSIDKSHYVRNTAETVKSVYENTKNLTTVGKKVFETAEAIVGSTGLKVSSLDVAIDTIDDRINYYTGSFDVNKKLSDYQTYFLGQLSTEYYQKVWSTLGQLKKSIVNTQTIISEKAPDSLSTDEMKKTFDQAIKQAVEKSHSLISAVLEIPGQDAFKSLPTPIMNAVQYIKSTPEMFKKASHQLNNHQQIQGLLNEMTSLVDSVTNIFGSYMPQSIIGVNTTTITTTATVTITSPTQIINPITVIKILQDFKDNCTELPQKYYQQIQDSVVQVEESITNIQANFKEKTLTEEDLKKLFDQTIKKSKELIDAVLHVPGQDLQSQLSSSIVDGVEHIKSIPSIFKMDIQKIKNVDNAKELIEKISNLINSISTVYCPEPQEVTEEGRLC